MEASGGPDGGGSEASYESVASEGGYEPASDRGRDPLPRIISSSHCVEVFRRVRWADGCFCCHAADKAHGRRGDPLLRPLNPLAGLPPRLLRFDGAIEAWLEEMPLPRDPHHVPRPYASLNDATTRQTSSRADLSMLRAGNRRATLWYFTMEFLQQLWPFFLDPDGNGPQLWEKALLDRGCTIQSTHVEVGQVHCPQMKNSKARTSWLKDLFATMQASQWAPDGEARALLANRRVSHASMSIGDVVQIGNELFMAGLSEFLPVKEGARLVPQQADSPEHEFEERSGGLQEAYDFEPPARGKAAKGDSEKDGSSSGEQNASGSGDSGGQKRRNRKRRGRKNGGGKHGDGQNGANQEDKGRQTGGQNGGGPDGGRGPKGKGRGGKGDGQDAANGNADAVGKKGGKGKGRGKGGDGADAGRKGKEPGAKEPRAKEPAPPAAAAPGERVDRRKLRAQLQEQREKLRGGH